jgi:uncharacterized protein (DUF1800 family)
MGLSAYLDEQLNPEAIDDTAAELMLRNLSLYHMDASQLAAQEPRDAVGELVEATIMRALYSERQLYEALVEFWSDHFNIFLRKNQIMPLLKTMDDRDVIRPHALGRFKDLLSASMRSPAMLVYLDNARNRDGQINENYARELMELHTLGVEAGYTQQDVREVARALTGLSVARRGLRAGQFVFDASQHDMGEKRILGHVLPAGQGEEDVGQVQEILLAHASTARFIATKLVRRFVADDPPAALINRVAETFQNTDGDIPNMLRTMFLSDEFANSAPKLKRPFTFMISALRALHADLRPSREIGRWLQLLGQPLFGWPPPDGYPDIAASWASNLLPRWNFALAMAHDRIPGTAVPLERIVLAGGVDDVEGSIHLFARLLVGGSLDEDVHGQLVEYVGRAGLGQRVTQQRLKDVVALMLASPDFQWT